MIGWSTVLRDRRRGNSDGEWNLKVLTKFLDAVINQKCRDTAESEFGGVNDTAKSKLRGYCLLLSQASNVIDTTEPTQQCHRDRWVDFNPNPH
jgi:hypothetical protein